MTKRKNDYQLALNLFTLKVDSFDSSSTLLCWMIIWKTLIKNSSN